MGGSNVLYFNWERMKMSENTYSDCSRKGTLMSTLRLMSQNQWNRTDNHPYWEEKGLDCSSEVRMKGHTKVFKEIMPDIIGGQEVNKDMQLDLRFYCLEEGLPYTLIWGNMTPIIYRADKLELLDTEYILYPEEVEGFEGSFCDAKSKSANLGVFRDKESGKVFIFLTTHLWWKNGQDPDRQGQTRFVLCRLKWPWI